MTIVLKDNGNRKMEFLTDRLNKYIDNLANGSNIDSEALQKYKSKAIGVIGRKEKVEATEISKLLKLNALDEITKESSNWTNVARNVLLNELYKEASYNRGYDAKEKYGNLYGLLKKLGSKGIYNRELLKTYSKQEIDELQSVIVPERDMFFDYLGLLLLSERYLVKDHDKNLYELPQERWMIIAMDIMRNEKKEKRLEYVKELYFVMSLLYLTPATPTLKTAGLEKAQYASCFVDTLDDSLRNIYDSNTDVADLSKNGAGLGVFVGSVRAKGSAIREYKGVGSGIMGWLKQLDNTATTVNQLGTRKGSIAVYLQVWHKDFFDFVDMKLNTGDDSIRCHNLFNGAIIPDLFMEKVEKREDWYLMCPHEIKTEMGYSLEYFYDEKDGEGSFREKYQECVDNPRISKTRVPAIDIWKRIAKARRETGTPYLMFIDEVNRQNPNKHDGIILSSNLCSEIAQNMSPTNVISEELDEETGIIKTLKASGSFVTCNLSSISLQRILKEKNPLALLKRVIKIQMRALDNVVDLNDVGVKQARYTNLRMRAVGLGVMGHAHYLAYNSIRWESDEAVKFVDDIHELIAFNALEASMELAKEKSPYPLFEGSEWHTGAYLKRKGYFEKEDNSLVSRNEWIELNKKIQMFGLRNGYLQSPPPTGSISVINGTTAGIDPIFDMFYYEEKKDYKVPVVVPDLNAKTTWFYKNAFLIDQRWSIEQNAKRQKHVDQAVSFNLYIPQEMKLSEMLELDMLAWKSKLKTIYYTRTKSLELIDCEYCQ